MRLGKSNVCTMTGDMRAEDQWGKRRTLLHSCASPTPVIVMMHGPLSPASWTLALDNTNRCDDCVVLDTGSVCSKTRSQVTIEYGGRQQRYVVSIISRVSEGGLEIRDPIGFFRAAYRGYRGISP